MSHQVRSQGLGSIWSHDRTGITLEHHYATQNLVYTLTLRNRRLTLIDEVAVTARQFPATRVSKFQGLLGSDSDRFRRPFVPNYESLKLS